MVEKPIHREYEQIVDKSYQLENLINMDDLRKLLEDFHKIAPFPVAVLNFKGDVLLESHWEPICTRFHRVNPKTAAICAESDIHFNAELAKGNERHILYRCANGLYDAASPIIIEGQHLGNFFIGQFLLEPPDEGFFRKQAQRYGFEEEAYLEALSRVPIISEHGLKNRLDYLCGFAEFLGNVGLKEFQRDRAQEALASEKQRIAYILQGTNAGTWEWNVQTGETVFNERWAKIIGYTLEEISPVSIDTWTKYTHPDDLKMSGKLLEKHFNGELDYYEYETRMRHKNGDWIWVLDRGKVATWTGDGKPLLMSGTHLNITASKLAEAALRKSEALLSATQQLAKVGGWEWDVKSKTMLWSEETYRIHDFQRDEFEPGSSDHIELGLKCYDPEDRPIIMGAFKRCIEKGQAYELEFSFTTAKGRRKWIRTAAQPVLEDDRIVKVVGKIMDITVQKQAEEALRESEEEYRLLIENATDAIFIAQDQILKFANSKAEAMTEYSREELVKIPFVDIIHPENREMVIERHLKRLKGEELPSVYSFRIINKSGKELSVELNTILVNWGGRPATLNFMRDITAQQRLEAQLQRTQKMEAIATLAGGVAHEFNNALTGIMGNIELLKMNLSEDERQDKYFERMKRSSHRMSRLTDQLLAYAEGGKYQPKNMRLDDFVIETLPILQYDLSPEVRVETHFPKDISYIKADNAQMQMVLSAILANSNEATEEEGLIRITAGNKDVGEDLAKQYPGLKPGRYVCLTIEDGGKGMDKETRTGIFEPFFTTKFQGRGMGMAAVYGIVKNHGGWIYVNSELGKGTVVQIYLPAVEAVAAKPKKATAEVARGSGTILMIEDEDVVIEVTQAMLEMLGYRVLVAKTGKDAIHITETFDGQIDLALLDIKLPDMEGGKVYPLIMGSRPSLKVIVFSGYAIDGPARKILDAGAQDFIQKPFSLATLSEKLKEVWEGE